MVTDEFITEEKFNQLKSYSLVPGDIVMTRKGTVGNSSVYPDDFQVGMMHSDLLRLRMNRNKCSPEFISFQFHISRDIEHQVRSVSSGAVMAGINVSRLKEISVVVPPVSLQNKFEEIVMKIVGRQKKQSKYLVEQTNLFGALTQQAFRGELTKVAIHFTQAESICCVYKCGYAHLDHDM